MTSERSKNHVFWLTGLSGSGKTTLAHELKKNIPNSIILDGDVLREVLGTVQGGFDKESRLKLALTYARLCKMIAEQDVTVIIATISLFHAVHAWNRENLPNYIEIFLDVPENIRRKRDSKGLYLAQEQGKVTQMAGIETNVEFPVNPHISINHNVSLENAVQEILNFLD